MYLNKKKSFNWEFYKGRPTPEPETMCETNEVWKFTFARRQLIFIGIFFVASNNLIMAAQPFFVEINFEAYIVSAEKISRRIILMIVLNMNEENIITFLAKIFINNISVARQVLY